MTPRQKILLIFGGSTVLWFLIAAVGLIYLHNHAQPTHSAALQDFDRDQRKLVYQSDGCLVYDVPVRRADDSQENVLIAEGHCAVTGKGV